MSNAWASLADIVTSGRGEVTAALSAAPPAPTADPSTFPIASPWSTSHLEKVVADDVFGNNRPVNTRAAAMRIPAVARARNLVVSSICRMPLIDHQNGEPATNQPTWLTRVRDVGGPQLRLAWTVDDLMFYGWSCWWRDNRADSWVDDARRLNVGSWRINGDMRVEVHGQVVNDDNVIVFPGLHEGILTYGVEALEDARQLYRNVRKRLATPTPGLNLQQQPESQRDLTNEEIDDLIKRWAAARTGEHGGVSYTSKGIKAEAMSGDDGALMIEARNAAAVDVARMIGISAGLIDATTPKASLNYETATGRNAEFVDRDLELYITPIEARLSAPDVTPNGHTVVIDQGEFTALPSSQAPAAPAPVPVPVPTEV